MMNCSCDTMVALGNSTVSGDTIFGKNSDRDDSEIQLVCFYPMGKYSSDENLKCTYISIPQVENTYPILLSQPYWMWGGEMGVNSQGVAIGNEAVWTVEKVSKSGLLGMDLLRLGLERGGTAKEALEVIISLLEKHGQGGNCAKGFSFTYHNSFIICDYKEAYVLETAGFHWVWEAVKNVRSISNNLSIMKTGDCIRPGTVKYAIEKKLCKSEDDFDFAVAFSQSWHGPDSRELATGNFLKKNRGKISPNLLTSILRNHSDSICMHGGFESTGAQISSLGKTIMENYFTATDLPCKSMFHPFAFADEKRQDGISVFGNHQNSLWVKHNNKRKIGSVSNEDIEKSRVVEKNNMEIASKLFASGNIEEICKLHNESVNHLKTIFKI